MVFGGLRVRLLTSIDLHISLRPRLGVRSAHQDSFRDSMRSIESRFNRKFGYPWVLFNDVPFEDSFKTAIRRMTRSEVSFHTIPKEHWGYPAHINQTAAKESMAQMGKYVAFLLVG